MRINDFHNILELVKQDILQSDAEYLKLLRVVGNNQRYDFRSQLSIYDRNPEATACAKFDYWRERFNRTVMRGQKGIPILEDYGTYKKVDYMKVMFGCPIFVAFTFLYLYIGIYIDDISDSFFDRWSFDSLIFCNTLS